MVLAVLVTGAMVEIPTAQADNTRLNDSVVANVYTVQHQAGCTTNVHINPQLRLAAQWLTHDVLNNRNLNNDTGSDDSTPQDRANAAGFHGTAVPPMIDESGRPILYVGEDLATSASEVFGEAGIAAICPRYRVSIVAPIRPLAFFDLARRGAALAIGALPALADGSEARSLTQQWARGIFEDRPAGQDVCGVRYRTAYNFGYSLALWDCDDSVEIVRDAADRIQDLPLNDVRVLGRLQVQMRKRRIDVTTVSEDECVLCREA